MMIKAPADLEIPEGTKEGDTFEAMTTFVMKPGGMLMVQAIEGSPVEKDMEDEGEDMEEGESMEDEGESMEEGKPMKGKMGGERGGMAPGFLIAIERGMSKKK
jgi:hypothetical protein